MSAEAAQRPLTVISALLRALAHKVRTPLSVISNDLTFFKSKGFETECARDLEKVKQISDLLRRCTTSVLHSSVADSISLKELCERIPSVKLISSASQGERRIKVDPVQLNIVLELTLESLSNFSPKRSIGAEELQAQLSSEQDGRAVIVIQHPFASFASISENTRFSSLTDLFNGTLDSDLPWPPIADAILWDMPGNIEALVKGDGISIRIEIGL